MFSGGEPTAQAEIVDAARAVRALGFAVGLHTGGAYPRRLAQLLPEIDWVGLDVKAPQGHYAAVTGVRDSGAAALASLDLVRNAGCLYEVRTTVHPDITPADSLERLARELAVRRIERWVLQAFRPTGCTDASTAAASGNDPRSRAARAAFRARSRDRAPRLISGAGLDPASLRFRAVPCRARVACPSIA